MAGIAIGLGQSTAMAMESYLQGHMTMRSCPTVPAVYLTPEGHTEMPNWLNNLRNSFQSHFQHTGDLADLSNAIAYQQKAIHLTPEGHAGMPDHLNNLGNSCQSHFKCTKYLADILMLLFIDHQCATYSSGPPST